MPAVKILFRTVKNVALLEQVGVYREGDEVHEELYKKRLKENLGYLKKGDIVQLLVLEVKVDQQGKTTTTTVLEEHFRDPVEVLELNLAAKDAPSKVTPSMFEEYYKAPIKKKYVVKVPV